MQFLITGGGGGGGGVSNTDRRNEFYMTSWLPQPPNLGRMLSNKIKRLTIEFFLSYKQYIVTTGCVSRKRAQVLTWNNSRNI